MDVTTISMPKKEAEKAYGEYLAIVKTRKEGYVKDLKKVYHALKEGKKVIDIYDAFKDTGVNEEGDPKLAIAIASEKSVFFFKEDSGAGIFSKSGWHIASIGGGCDSHELENFHDEDEANARLIAAAPDLLFALQTIAKTEGATVENLRAVAKAALSKAKQGVTK